MHVTERFEQGRSLKRDFHLGGVPKLLNFLGRQDCLAAAHKASASRRKSTAFAGSGEIARLRRMSLRKMILKIVSKQ